MRIFHINLRKPFFGRTADVNIAVSEAEGISPCLSSQLIGKDYSVEELMANMTEGDELDPYKKEGLAFFIRELVDRFSSKPARTEVLKHDIELPAETSMRSKPYRVSHRE